MSKLTLLLAGLTILQMSVKEMIAGVAVLAAAISVAEANPVPVRVDLGAHAPVAVIPEPFAKINLGGVVEGRRNKDEGRRRSRHTDPPARKLKKAS